MHDKCPIGRNAALMNDEAYTCDANGNRETANGATYTTSANNRLASDGTYNYEYDAEGNRTKQTNIATGDYRTFTWDHRNRLVAVTDFDSLHNEWQRIEYAYDIDQHLVGRQVFLNGSSTASESQHFVFDGDQMTLVLDDAGAVEHRYLWGPAVDQILADEVDIATSGYENTSWALTDHLNSVRDWIAEESANPGTFSLENHLTLDTFGRQTAETNASAIDHLLNYTARYTDPLTGLQWNLHRWYDPQVGRWISEDWIEDDLQNPNRYSGNRVLSHSDPTGQYAAAGHFYTTYIVARAAGLSAKEAYELAYYSQLPDQVADFDATSNWLDSWNPLSDRNWPISVFVYLHSLNGKCGKNVDNYRAGIADLVALKCCKLSAWERGILIHVFGDAYAHTFGPKGNETAYRWPDGHGNMGHRPDVIGNDPDKYKNYVRSLYASLGGTGSADDNRIIAALFANLPNFPTGGFVSHPEDEAQQIILFIRQYFPEASLDPITGDPAFVPGNMNTLEHFQTPTKEQLYGLFAKVKKCLARATTTVPR